MNEPRVSVIIPTRNRLVFLQEAVASVLAQTFPYWELLIVDDASEDGTWAWLESLDEPRIRAIHLHSHSERSAARNRGLEQARGEFVLFLDDDDALYPRALEYLVKALERHADVVAGVGARVAFDSRGHERRCPHPWVALKRTMWAEIVVGWIGGVGQTIFRRAALREVGGWNESLDQAEHHELWLKVSRVGVVQFLPRPVLKQRLHSGHYSPSDMTTAEQEVRQNFVMRLPSNERAAGSRLLEFRCWFHAASREYLAARPGQALACYFRALHRNPALVTSPIVGPEMVGNILKCCAALLLGSRFYNALRHLRAAGRRLVNGDPRTSGPVPARRSSGH